MTEERAGRGPRIAIAGFGIVTTAGRGPAATLAALRSGGAPPAAPRTIRSELSDRYPVFEVPDAAFDDPPCRLPGGRGRRGVRMALVAGLDAMTRAATSIRAERFGVVAGATVGGMMHTEDWAEERLRAAGGGAASGPSTERAVAVRPAIRHLPLWDASHALAAQVGARGPAMAVATACTSGAHAIAVGAELIAAGVCDAVLAGGVDGLSRVTYHGFASLQLCDRVRCRPFDRARAGLNLGEGAAFVLLARGDAAGPPVAWLEGWASTSDAHHPTAPRPDGSGLAAASRRALALAGVSARDADWIHAHGTATQGNDGVEALAIRAVLGDADVPVSSTKYVFGHTLGAAGAVSAVVALLAMREGFIPGNGPVGEQEDGAAISLVPPEGLRRPVRRVVVHAMGFGGTNAALVLAGSGT